MKTGNKFNAFLNGEYARHIKPWLKRHTAHLRRRYHKVLTKKLLDE